MNIMKVRIKRKVKRKKPHPRFPVQKIKEEDEIYTQSVEVREKRIGIVFKVIYVVAIFFAAVFALLAANAGNGLTDMYMIEVAATTVFLTILIYMVSYIINEMKCMKLYAADLSQKQIEATENSYANIFLGLKTSGTTVLCLIVVLSQVKEYLTGVYVAWGFIISLAVFLALPIISTVTKGKGKGVVEVLRCVLVTTMLICLFLLPAFDSPVASIS